MATAAASSAPQPGRQVPRLLKSKLRFGCSFLSPLLSVCPVACSQSPVHVVQCMIRNPQGGHYLLRRLLAFAPLFYLPPAVSAGDHTRQQQRSGEALPPDCVAVNPLRTTYAA